MYDDRKYENDVRMFFSGFVGADVKNQQVNCNPADSTHICSTPSIPVTKATKCIDIELTGPKGSNVLRHSVESYFMAPKGFSSKEMQKDHFFN